MTEVGVEDGSHVQDEVSLQEGIIDQELEHTLEGPKPVDINTIPQNVPNYGAVLKKGLMEFPPVSAII